MRARGTLALLLLLGVACRAKDEPPVPTPACNLGELSELARHLDGLAPGEDPLSAWHGLRGACGDALPSMAAQAFDLTEIDARRGQARPARLDTNSRALQLDACPTWLEVEAALAELPSEQHAARVVQACNFTRFGVFDEHELPHAPRSMIATWAIHAWLLDQGLAPEAARSITRALYLLELRNALLGEAHLDVELPLAEGSPVPRGPALVLTPTAIRMGGQRIAELQDGRPPLSTPEGLIRPLYEALRRAVGKGEQAPPLRLIADASTRYEALYPVVYTAERAGLEHFALLVRTEGKLGYSQLPLRASGRWSRGTPGARVDEGLRASIEFADDGLAELEARVQAVASEGPGSGRALVSAGADFSLARLVVALEMLRAEGFRELILVEGARAARPSR